MVSRVDPANQEDLQYLDMAAWVVRREFTYSLCHIEAGRSLVCHGITLTCGVVKSGLR